MNSKELLGENVLFKQGAFEVVELYYRGWNPELGGEFVEGWSGRETKVTKDRIRPRHTFTVKNSQE